MAFRLSSAACSLFLTSDVAEAIFFFLMIRRPPRSTLFPYRRSSDLLHPFLNVARRCFVFLDECCTLHRRCCTMSISILRTAITVASFRVTGVITSQNEGLSEFYGFDRCKPSTDSFIPKKKLSEPQSGL